MHKLLARWLPKALLQLRQIKGCLAANKLPVRNLGDWANSVNISLRKVKDYYGKLVDLSPELAVISAHRQDLLAVMDKLAIARETRSSPMPPFREKD